MSDAREEALRSRHDGAEDFRTPTAQQSCATCRHCPELANSPDGSEWICTHPKYCSRLYIGYEPSSFGSDCPDHELDLDEQTEEITRTEEELHPRRPANEPPPDGSKASAPPAADRAHAWKNAAIALDDAARELDDALGELRYAKEMSAAAYHAGTGYEPDHTAAAHAARILPDQDSRTRHTAVDLVCMARRAREAGEALIQHAIDEDNESPKE